MKTTQALCMLTFALLAPVAWAQQSTVTVEAVAPATAIENGAAGTFRVRRDGGDVSGSLSVDFTRDPTTTISNSDFSANDNGTFESINRVVFTANEVERLVVITATPDNLVEGDEFFDITLAAGSYVIGTPNAAGLTLVDDPPVVTVTSQSPSTENGADGEFAFQRSGGKLDASLNVHFTRDATTTADNSDISVPDNGSFEASNLVNLAAGQAQRTLPVTAVADNLVEGDEFFDITLAAGSYVIGTPNAAGLTLVDDPPVVTVTSQSPSTENGADGEFAFQRSGGKLDASLNVHFTRDATTTADNSDISVPDNGSFEASNLVNLAAGQAQRTLPVTAVADNLVEGDEFFDITLAAGSYVIGTPNAAGLTLVDDPPVVTVTSQSPSTENGADGEFAFQRSGGKLDASLNVHFTRDATTTADNSDISVPDNGSFEASNLVNLAAGQAQRTLPVTAVADNLVEGDEFFDITLAAGSYVIGTPDAAGLTLVDDPAVVTVMALDGVAEEGGGSASFLFQRSGGEIARTLSVSFSRDPTTTVDNDDFQVDDNGSFRDSNTVALASGQSERIIEIFAVEDGIDEGEERLDITLASDGISFLAASPASAGIIIIESDVLFKDDFEDLLNLAEGCGIDEIAGVHPDKFVDAGPVLLDRAGLVWLRCFRAPVYNASAQCQANSLLKSTLEGMAPDSAVAEFNAGMLGDSLGFNQWRWATAGELAAAGLHRGACLVLD